MKAIVNNSCCQILYREKLPRKTVGKTIEVEFSADWEGLAITAVFEAGDVKKDVVYTGKPIIIPHEVLATEGLSVMLGFHGARTDGTIIKRTVPEWINNVSASLDPSGETSSEPTPDWAAQVQAIALEAKEAADSVRSDAEAGKFNGAAGGWYTPAVTQPNENTMRLSFSPSKKGMPAVADTDIALPSGGGGGGSGEDGGYYTPVVTQPSGNTMRVSFTPSKAAMPAVDRTEITLPAGPAGSKGEKGDKGADGKSAYRYAVEGGFTGTEEEFAAKLAGEIPTVDSTLAKSGQAADAATVGDRLSALSEEIVTTSESKVAAHNTGTDTHSDIRLLIQGLTDRLNALADSDDTTLDQLSEVVAYIKSNRSLIEAITTSKVSVADIVDNLTTNVSNKPLSAAQGVVIKTLIDALRNDKLDAAELTNAVNTALAQAKSSGEFDGADGKSAYQYAQEGGYTGTETEFAEKLAQEQLTGTTGDLTPIQVYDAVSAGIPVKVQHTDGTYGLLSFTAFNVAESLNVVVSQTIVYYNGVYILAQLWGNKSSNIWGVQFAILAQKTDIPTALPNPNALTFTGAVTGNYDGSTAKTVNIPSAVTDAHINSLIDTKLGVIENGAY